ncbi:LptA/OstA family protein [Myxococcota bacterium]|nr:LptA/OstA family protein [Myxococcota bacterium]
MSRGGWGVAAAWVVAPWLAVSACGPPGGSGPAAGTTSTLPAGALALAEDVALSLRDGAGGAVDLLAARAVLEPPRGRGQGGSPLLLLAASGSGRGEEGGGETGGSAPAAPHGPPPEAVDIRADRAQADARSHHATFEGSVVVTRGELALRCERLRVTYDPEAGQVVRAEASGGVRIVMGDRQATGAEAAWDLVAGVVELQGSPTLAEGRSVLSGERIRVFVDARRVECERCRAVVDSGAAPPPAAR